MKMIKYFICKLLSYFHDAACLYSEKIPFWYYSGENKRFTEREIQKLSTGQFLKIDRNHYIEDGFSLYYQWQVPKNFTGKMIVFSLDNTCSECPQLSLYVNGKLQQSVDEKHSECVLTTSGRCGDKYNIFLSSIGKNSRMVKVLASFKAVELKAEKWYQELASHKVLKKVACFL